MRKLGGDRPTAGHVNSESETTVREPVSAVIRSLVLMFLLNSSAIGREPIPDKLVVLTFDDSVKSHFTVVGPELKKRGFGATFFVTEGFEFKTDKLNYMTWEEIARLHRDGFEIGNHTRDHFVIRPHRMNQFRKQLDAIDQRCAEFGIPKPKSFAYAGNSTTPEAFQILKEAGFQFARRGGQPERPYENGEGFAYEPGFDHPLLIPSAGDARPDWKLDDFKKAVSQAHSGRIVVLQFHGVPDKAHPWVNSPIERFREYMDYLKDNNFQVVALRDLARYVDPNVTPSNPDGIVNDRRNSMIRKESRDNFRTPKNDEDLKRWLQNMVWHHQFSNSEIRAATGLSPEQIEAAKTRFNITMNSRPSNHGKTSQSLTWMPYPGGRHPRTGFLDGAIRPQRETKISVFLPWDRAQYLVLDIPEAIRRNNERWHGLLYLAHTHVPTMWDRQRIRLKQEEWERTTNGNLTVTRTLPNNVSIQTIVSAVENEPALAMEMSLKNHSQEKLSRLVVQNCLMLKGSPEFAATNPKDHVIDGPYVAIRSAKGDRWCIMAWEPNHRAWNNPPCPCVHSDPVFPDCLPGEEKRLTGWLSFFEGTTGELSAEIDRVRSLRKSRQPPVK